MAVPITLTKTGLPVVLKRLATSDLPGSNQLYVRLAGAWGHRPDRQRVTIKVGKADLELLRALKLPKAIEGLGMLNCGWLVTYRHPKRPDIEVVVHCTERPKKRRTFRIGNGKRRLVAVEVQKLGSNNGSQPNHKEAVQMATKTKKRKAVEEDELDELEGLEDLEDLEDEDLEEPEDEEDEDEEEEEEAPKRSRRTKAKAPAKKGKARQVEEDDEEDEDEEDEDEEPAPRKRGRAKSATAKSSKAKGATKKAAKKGRPIGATGPRELPQGKYGPREIAEEVDVDPRTVRIFLRENADDLELERDGSQWIFSKRDYQRVVKAMKARQRG